MINKYRKDIDVLKGIAIIAVVLYHMGFLESGYLGVDAFFVVSGFLTLPKLINAVEKQEFSYFRFIRDKIIRLAPLLIIGIVACLGIGYFVMLPDDYENLAQSSVASLLFSNNILSAITTKNYWNVANDYKPLMHTWYLGILAEFYLVIPIVIMIFRCMQKKFCRADKVFSRFSMWGLLVLSFASLIIFLLPGISVGSKFYYIPFRLYELTFGGVAGLLFDKVSKYKKSSKDIINLVSMVSLVAVIFSSIALVLVFGYKDKIVPIGAQAIYESNLILPNSIMVVLTVILTMIVLVTSDCDSVIWNNGFSSFFMSLGKRSYSIFIWHQILIAFFRYTVSYDMDLVQILIYFITVIVVSCASYLFIERKVKVNSRNLVLVAISVIIVCIPAMYLYMCAGVVRDIPELGISKNNVHRSMHAEYVDRVYNYNKDFEEENKKINVLVVGNSFARDWVNIILESKYAGDVNISYASAFSEGIVDRVQQSDYIFSFSAKDEVPQYVWENLKNDTEVWGIGTKNFGECNGVIYSKRYREDYFTQSIVLDTEYEKLNNEWKNQWGDQYVDMIELVRNDDGTIKCFTNQNMYISQDCHHLTKAGAEYYAELVNFSNIFGS